MRLIEARSNAEAKRLRVELVPGGEAKTVDWMGEAIEVKF